MWPYIQIARPDHWFKNVFVLPGVLLVFFFSPESWGWGVLPRLLLAFLSVCLVASSNYVLNEILDAPYDQYHPVKKHRPIPSGKINLPVACGELILLAAAGLVIGFRINPPFGLTALALWVMGILYNVKPMRLKDLAYADVLSESVNNPLRLLLGWYGTGCMLRPPLSIALAYWMFGAFLMATKRLAEYRDIGDPDRAAKYRKSFGYYTEERLLVSIIAYVALFAMFSGFFIARYHRDVILATPIVVVAMGYYLRLGFMPHSVVQYPEGLYREHKLSFLIIAAFVTCCVLLYVDLPHFDALFVPTYVRTP
jgi:decaprenyl-phosphate phosphoribosyltransferase